MPDYAKIVAEYRRNGLAAILEQCPPVYFKCSEKYARPLRLKIVRIRRFDDEAAAVSAFNEVVPDKHRITIENISNHN